MRILLIKPANPLSDHIQPPLGLGYLATALRSFGHLVKILDCQLRKVKTEKIPEAIPDFRPEVIGIQFFTQDIPVMRNLLAGLKKFWPQSLIVVGGPHPTACPQEVLQNYPQIDFCFIGEAEISFPRFLALLGESSGSTDFSRVPGLAWRENNTIKKTPGFFSPDIDIFGEPAWDLIQPQKYPPAQHGAFFKNFPIAPIITGRGCPYSCSYCAAHLSSGRLIRRRKIENVLAEIRRLVTDFGIREIHIVDDNFTFDRNYVLDFCRALVSARLNISWTLPNGVRLDRLDEEMLLAMKESGLYLIAVAVETASDRILRLVKKGLTRQQIEQGLSLINRAGIAAAGFFILGFPTETREEIFETIKFSRQLNLIRANYFTFLPLPGTEAYAGLSAEERKRIDWEKFDFTSVVYQPSGISRRQLRNWQRQAFLSFYLRPKVLFRNLSQIRSWRHLFYLLRRAIHWLLT